MLNLDVEGIDIAATYDFDTDAGGFNIGAALTHKTKFDQFFGANGTKFSVLGTAGFNTTFPSVEDEGRLELRLRAGGLRVQSCSTTISATT